MRALNESISAPKAQEGTAAPVSAELLPYQVHWITDKNPLRLWEKSRRIGASYTLALEAV